MAEAFGEQSIQYDYCLSFADEQRRYVKEVAKLLRRNEVRVFYDAFESATLLGEQLTVRLDEVFNRLSRFCVMFVSADYERKMWTSLERSSALDRALREHGAPYIIVVRFDDTTIPGLQSAIGHFDARTGSPAELVNLLMAKLERASPAAGALAATIVVLDTDESATATDDILDLALERRAINAVHRARLGPATAVALPIATLSTLDVLTQVIPALEWATHDYNADLPGTRVRIAVHRGEIPGGTDWTCVDVSTAFDAVNARIVRDTLAAATKSSCAVVASQRIYDEIIGPGLPGITPSLYRKITLPKGNAWIRVPGYPKPPDPSTPPPAASPPDNHTKFHVVSPGTVHQIGDRYYQAGSSDDR